MNVVFLLAMLLTLYSVVDSEYKLIKCVVVNKMTACQLLCIFEVSVKRIKIITVLND